MVTTMITGTASIQKKEANLWLLRRRTLMLHIGFEFWHAVMYKLSESWEKYINRAGYYTEH